MRSFAFIMSFVVLAMSCMPCMDASAAMNDKGRTEVSTADHCSLPCDSDGCTAFCTCNCCGGFTVTATFTQASYLKALLAQKKALYLSEKISSISLPIWQPPQLV